MQENLYRDALGMVPFPPPCGPTMAYYPGNNDVYSKSVPIFLCPSDPSVDSDGVVTINGFSFGASSYAPNAMVTAPHGPQGRARLNDILDGTSNTILHAEKYARCSNTTMAPAFRDGGTAWAYCTAILFPWQPPPMNPPYKGFGLYFMEFDGKRVLFTGDMGFEGASDILHRCWGDNGPVVWDIKTGDLKWQGKAEVFGEWPKRLAFSKDGKMLAGVAALAKPVLAWHVQVWDVQTGQSKIRLPMSGTVEFLTFLSDGITLATTTRTEAIFWDLQTGQQKLRVNWLLKHPSDPPAVAFSPDGKYVATAEWRNGLRLWDLETGKEKRKWPPWDLRTGTICFSPDGKMIAMKRDFSGPPRDSANLMIWDVETGAPKWMMTAEIQAAHFADGSPDCQLAFSADTRLFASAGQRMKVWRLGEPLTVPALGAALKKKDVKMRKEALFALSYFGPSAKTVIPELLETLKDNDEDVRVAALNVLGNIGPEAKAAVPFLLEALRTWPKSQDLIVESSGKTQRLKVWPKSRSAVIGALGMIGPEAKEAGPAIIEALQDGNEFTKIGVGAALARIGFEDKALPILVDGLGQNVIDFAAQALGQMGPKAKTAVPALIAAMGNLKTVPAGKLGQLLQ